MREQPFERGGGFLLVEEAFVDLKPFEELFFFRLSFLSHAQPDISIDDVRIGDSYMWIVCDRNVRRIKSLEEKFWWLVCFWRRDCEFESKVLRSPHP